MKSRPFKLRKSSVWVNIRETLRANTLEALNFICLQTPGWHQPAPSVVRGGGLDPPPTPDGVEDGDGGGGGGGASPPPGASRRRPPRVPTQHRGGPLRIAAVGAATDVRAHGSAARIRRVDGGVCPHPPPRPLDQLAPTDGRRQHAHRPSTRELPLTCAHPRFPPPRTRRA